jgi:hypothetical protein
MNLPTMASASISREEKGMKVLRVLVCVLFLAVSLAAISAAAEPTTVSAPQDVKITPPDPILPKEIRVFFGETGKWWGTWYGDPPGRMEAILIIKKIIDAKSAEILYVVPDYPTWGIKAVAAERVATFEKRDGRLYLAIPPSRNGQRMEFTVDTGALVGLIEGPYLKASIVWEPLK